jgi:putative transposase
MTAYDTGAHTVFYHRYHIVWATKYRYKEGDLRRRIRDIIRQVCAELGVTIIKGVLSRDHVHLLVSIPPKHSVSEVVQRMKGRSSRNVQREFPTLGKRYWGRHFWAARPPATSGRPRTSVPRGARRYRRQPVVVH